MNNSKNTEKQKIDGAKKVDLLKNMGDCKKEAESLNLSIKKCLSLALGLKSQLKQKLEKINASALEEQQKAEEKRKEEERLKAEQIKKEEEKKIKQEKQETLPVWYGKDIKKKEMSEDDVKELESMLSDFR